MFEVEQLAPSPPVVPPHRALYLRWRPRRFEDVVGQEHVTRTLRNAVRLDRLAHAYLFTGPRGTGKTSVARILYRAANCAQPDDGDPCGTCPICVAALDGRAFDLVEIDAASNRGIDDIRDLRDKVAYRPGEGRYRVYIIDEAHELTPAAWDAFLKTLEEPPAHAIFVLATTEAHKVPATIVSRCQRFDFRRIPFDATREQLERVARAEGMQVDPGVLERLALVARGGLRDALSLLDQLAAFASGQIDMDVARAALSLPSIEAVRGVLDAVSRHEPAALMAVLADVAEGGADLRMFAEELVVHLRALLLVRTGADSRLGDELPSAEVAWLRERAPAWGVAGLMRLIQELSNALARTRDAQQFQVQVELALLSACEPVASGQAPAVSGQTSVVGDQASVATRQASVVSYQPAVASDGAPVVSEQAPPSVEADQARSLATGGGAPADAMAAIRDRWPDVVDHVRARKPMLGVLLSSAQPLRVENDVLVVGFGTEFNRKRAELGANRQAIEEGVRHALGQAYRLRCTLASAADGGPNLQDDPVINYAVRTFGGRPTRVAE